MTESSKPKSANAKYLMISYICSALLILMFFLYVYSDLGAISGRSHLVQDELWAATLANLSFLKSIVFVLRFDIHPPFYYMQLNLWAVFGRDDMWLRANSIFWQLATSMLVLHLVWQKHALSRRDFAEVILPETTTSKSDYLSRRDHQTGNFVIALIAAALVLSNPILVDYALELRMYTFLCFLTILGIMWSEGLFRSVSKSGRAPIKQWALVFLIYLALIYSYATGLIIVGAHFTYGILTALQAKLPRSFVLRWLGMHIILGVLALPVIANSMLRGVSHALLPDTWVILNTLSELAVGAERLNGWTIIVLTVFGATLLVALMTVPNSRQLIIAYFLIPLLAALSISYLLKPLWLTRSFVFVIPVLAVAIGRVLIVWCDRAWSRQRVAGVATAASMVIFVVFLQSSNMYRVAAGKKLPDYAFLTNVIRQNAEAGDCVVAFSPLDVFWGVARYLAGPDWDGGLRVQAPPAQRWIAIMASIPPNTARRLEISAQSDRFSYNGIQIIAGYPNDLATSCKRVFMVGKASDVTGLPTNILDFPTLAISGPVTIWRPGPGQTL